VIRRRLEKCFEVEGEQLSACCAHSEVSAESALWNKQNRDRLRYWLVRNDAGYVTIMDGVIKDV
jgi:hypothetical protein